MTKQVINTNTPNDLINVGSSANSKNGDALRTAFIKINNAIDKIDLNFSELYTAMNSGGASTGDYTFESSNLFASGRVEITNGSTLNEDWNAGIQIPVRNANDTLYIRNITVEGNDICLQTPHGTWTFDSVGDLTVSNDILANPSNDLNLKVFNPSGGGGVSISLQNRDANTGSKTTQFSVNPDSVSLITNFSNGQNEWTFRNDGVLQVPGPDFISWIYQDEVGLSLQVNGYPFKFGRNGNLKLPAGGDIVDSNGVSVLGGSSYSLPTATTTVLGGVKVDGTSITINPEGIISANGGGAPGGITITAAPTTSKGVSGNQSGMIAFDNSNFYYCKQNYTDGVADIWVKTAWTSTSW